MPDKSPDNGPYDHGTPDVLRHTAPRGLKLAGIIIVVIAALVVVAGIMTRVYADQKVVSWTDDQAVQTVQVLSLRNTKNGGSLSLPGDVQAFSTAPIYAQVSGVVQKWLVDIGALRPPMDCSLVEGSTWPCPRGEEEATRDPRAREMRVEEVKPMTRPGFRRGGR